MKTVTIPENLLEKLNVISGKAFDEKISNLLLTNAIMKLKECEDRIFELESKYGMDFDSFKMSWESGAVKDKYSHKVERDFMEWEGFESERKKWLHTLHDIRATS